MPHRNIACLTCTGCHGTRVAQPWYMRRRTPLENTERAGGSQFSFMLTFQLAQQIFGSARLQALACQQVKALISQPLMVYQKRRQ